MADWDPSQYLKFEDERTRPCRDLAARVAGAPGRIVDLGCGPGNSTEVLRARWPDARITGIDADEAMIDAASAARPAGDWQAGDITEWARDEGGEKFDLIFTNAALQWVPDHAALYPALTARLAPGGALAVQVPENTNAPAQAALREIEASAEFRADFAGGKTRDWHVLSAAGYYDVLAPRAARLDIWRTEYLHVMADAGALVEWYRGSALRPYLARLSDARQADFIAEFRARMAAAFPARADGRVLFPFMRLFLIACKG